MRRFFEAESNFAEQIQISFGRTNSRKNFEIFQLAWFNSMFLQILKT